MPSMNVSLTAEQIAADEELLKHLELASLKAVLAEGVRQAKEGDAEPFSLKDLIADLEGRK